MREVRLYETNFLLGRLSLFAVSQKLALQLITFTSFALECTHNVAATGIIMAIG